MQKTVSAIFTDLQIPLQDQQVQDFFTQAGELAFEDIQYLKSRAEGKGIIKPSVRYVFPSSLSIILTKHATERWNERVGPNQSKTQISDLLHQLHQLNRIEYFNHKSKVGLIDEEIVFIYEKIGLNKIVILTFYGRISIKSGLKRLTKLNEFNPRKDAVNLELEVDSKDYLKQTLPLLPFRLIEGMCKNEVYIIEEYGSKDKPFQFIRIFNGGHLKSTQTTNANFYIGKYFKPTISSNVIQIDTANNTKKQTKNKSNKKQKHFISYPWLSRSKKYEVIQNKNKYNEREDRKIKKPNRINNINAYKNTSRMSDEEFEETLINLLFD